MLRAGIAAVEITPEAGSLMACFPDGKERTPRRAKGALDPLMAKALVLSDGAEPVAICALDVALLRAPDVKRIREGIVARCPDIDPSRVMLCASHTHSSPETAFLFGNTPEDPYLAEMAACVADVVAAAANAMEPVTLRFGRTPTDLNHNRLVRDAEGKASMVMEHDPDRTTGPVDPDLSVLRFDRPSGDPLAILWHFTGHALTLGPKTYHYTADYPGAVCRALEGACGGTALFVNGAAGNVHPRQCMRQDTAARDKIAAALGAIARETCESAEPVASEGLAFVSKVRPFANRVDESLTVDVELAALRVGEVRFVFVPGEPFVEFQLALREAVEPPPLLFVGYANDWCGYMPTREAYEGGGYGVEKDRRDPPSISRTALPPGAGESVRDTLREMLARI